MLNETPLDWHSKKQSTVETEIHGSECSSARNCGGQILYFRITLSYLGVPIRKLSYMFGDDSVVNSSMTPKGKIHKMHVALSIHRVRKDIAAKITSYQFISGKINPADVSSKHWTRHCVWPILKPLLFWKGDTMECLDNNDLEFEE